ncbi:hypothetical protein B0J14DRAFT_555428 [Halenospora varia]|nr:hypothetical protein B0J14DRAFT_555428 [Halenospora varia]
MFLPDITESCQTLPITPMYEGFAMENLKTKVLFFDSMLDRAYEQETAPFGIRKPSIGYEINRRLTKGNDDSPEFEIRTKPPRLLQKHHSHTTFKGPPRNISILFLTITPNTITSKCSEHKSAGKVQEADFWYLIQDYGMKLLSVLIFILSIRTRKDLSLESWVWTWAWIRLAITCPVAAPVCYIRHGTDWSSMLLSQLKDRSRLMVFRY